MAAPHIPSHYDRCGRHKYCLMYKYSKALAAPIKTPVRAQAQHGGNKSRHRCFIQAQTIYTGVSNQVRATEMLIGRSPAPEHSAQIEFLVHLLEYTETRLRELVEKINDTDIRSRIDLTDYQYILKRHERVIRWLERFLIIQQKLHAQLDLERGPRSSGASDVSSKASSACSESSFDGRKQALKQHYGLGNKPLPPIRKDVFRLGQLRQVTVYAEEQASEMRALGLILDEDDDIDPIIEAYRLAAPKSFKADGFTSLPPDLMRPWI